MQRNVRDVAAGRWPGILSALGVLDEKQLAGRHCPCPVCGGKDRFRFDDKEGRGTWFCSHFGAGNGVDLVLNAKGWDFKTAAKEIEQAAGVIPAGARPAKPDDAKVMDRLRRVWHEAKPLQPGDEAMRYLAGRGLVLESPPDCLRLHPALPYFDGRVEIGKFPVLLARVVAPDGTGATQHRTYLKNASKARQTKYPSRSIMLKPLIWL